MCDSNVVSCEGDPKSSTMCVKYVSGKPDMSKKVKLYVELEQSKDCRYLDTVQIG